MAPIAPGPKPSRSRRKSGGQGPFAVATTLILALILTLGLPSTQAAGIGLGELFGFPPENTAAITISEREQSSLGCLITATGVGIATILFSGAALAVTGGQGAATATTVAVPVLAAAMTAGCALGSQAAPGIIWLQRNSEALFGKVVNAIPAKSLVKVLPLPEKLVHPTPSP